MKKRRGLPPAKVRMNADMQAVLAMLGIEFEERGDELVARCRSGNHEDRNPSWSMHDSFQGEKNGFHHCHSCGWGGDVFHLVQHVKGCTFPEALDFVARGMVRQIPEDDELPSEAYLQTFKTREVTEPHRMPLGVHQVETGTPCDMYLRKRGVGQGEVDLYRIQDWRWRRRVFVPLTIGGELVSWLARSYADEKPKVLFPKGDTKGTRWGVFGVDQADHGLEVANVCEGWVSALRVGQAGFPNPVAICGAQMTEEQVEILGWTRWLILWQEGDAGGRVFVNDVKQWMGRGREIHVVELPEKTDPADFGPGQLKSFYDNRR